MYFNRVRPKAYSGTKKADGLGKEEAEKTPNEEAWITERGVSETGMGSRKGLVEKMREGNGGWGEFLKWNRKGII